jgi:hypothetical protein
VEGLEQPFADQIAEGLLEAGASRMSGETSHGSLQIMWDSRIVAGA